jgi:hypothetical protein
MPPAWTRNTEGFKAPQPKVSSGSVLVILCNESAITELLLLFFLLLLLLIFLEFLLIVTVHYSCCKEVVSKSISLRRHGTLIDYLNIYSRLRYLDAVFLANISEYKIHCSSILLY